MSVEDGEVITGFSYVIPGCVRLGEVMSGYIWLSQFKPD
jgi:hypothetical protein